MNDILMSLIKQFMPFAQEKIGFDKPPRLFLKNDVENAKTQVGVLAQDMEAILPEVVMIADDDMQTKSVDYGKLTAVLMEAVKQLSNEVTHLKQQILNGG